MEELKSRNCGSDACLRYCDTLDLDWTNTFANENLPGVPTAAPFNSYIEYPASFSEGYVEISVSVLPT